MESVVRVLLLTDELPEVARGGLDLHMHELSGALQARGLDVLLHAMRGGGENVPTGVEALAGRIADPLGDGPDVDDFRGVLDLYQPDVVHFQSLQGLSHRLPEEARRFGARVLWTLHDFFSICPRSHLHDAEGAPCDGPLLGAACGPCYGGFKGLLAAPMFGLRYAGYAGALGQCDHLLAPSKFVRDTLVAEGAPDARIQILAPAVPRPRRFAALPEGASECRFVFAGDLRWAKGADLAVEAMAMLRDQPVSLSVHGGAPAPPAPREQQFEEQIQATAGGSAVTFFGRYQPDELLQILDGAAALVVPSRVRESFGRTANLALMAGVPVIAAGHGAVPELVAEGLNGALFEPGNARSLAEAMRRLLDDGIDMQARVDDWPANPSLDDHVRELVRLYGAQA